MQTQLEIANKRLFDKDGYNVENIKIFRGDKNATAEQVAEQINKSLDQIEAGDYELIEDFED